MHTSGAHLSKLPEISKPALKGSTSCGQREPTIKRPASCDQKSKSVLQITAPNQSLYDNCTLCPRMCRAKRRDGEYGYCGMNATLRIARAALHMWEEPPISGERGSGAIFFSGCPLRCVFCQNHEISHNGFGLAITTDRLADIMCELQEQGAQNINLVTPSHFTPHILQAITRARKQGMDLPIVCNTSGYERVETINMLAEVVDIWLTDFKYATPKLAQELSGAYNMVALSVAALTRMYELLQQAGGRKLAVSGAMERGIIVRHLVLPEHAQESFLTLEMIHQITGGHIDLSVMNQYTPNQACRRRGDFLSRTVDDTTYEQVLCYADDLGFDTMWWQEGGTVSESFIPSFDATGVLQSAAIHDAVDCVDHDVTGQIHSAVLQNYDITAQVDDITAQDHDFTVQAHTVPTCEHL